MKRRSKCGQSSLFVEGRQVKLIRVVVGQSFVKVEGSHPLVDEEGLFLSFGVSQGSRSVVRNQRRALGEGIVIFVGEDVVGGEESALLDVSRWVEEVLEGFFCL